MPSFATGATARPPVEPGTGSSVGAQAPSQQADTDQNSSADARATQPQQTNVVVVIRINSPGDEAIAQTNTITVGATSSNDSSTDQVQAPQTESGSAAADPAAAPQPAATVGGPAAGAEPTIVQPAAEAPPHRVGIVLAAYARSNAAPEQGSRPVATTLSPSRRSLVPPTARAPSAHLAVAKPSAHGTDAAAKPNHIAVPAATKVAQQPAPGLAKRIPTKLAAVSSTATKLVGGGRAAASSALAADAGSSGQLSLGALTLVALLTGLLGWAGLTWASGRAQLPRARRRG